MATPLTWQRLPILTFQVLFLDFPILYKFYLHHFKHVQVYINEVSFGKLLACCQERQACVRRLEFCCYYNFRREFLYIFLLSIFWLNEAFNL
jgi:hypothetical protein